MSKHTPGPWFLEGNWEPGMGRLKGWVSSNPPAGSPVFELRPIVGTQENIIANARLIASAPLMLEALKRIREHCADSDHENWIWRTAEQAVAQAEGR